LVPPLESSPAADCTARLKGDGAFLHSCENLVIDWKAIVFIGWPLRSYSVVAPKDWKAAVVGARAER
jgi:hypothetical protein